MSIASRGDADQHSSPHGLTPRAVILGGAVAATSVFWAMYAEYIIDAARLNLSSQPMASFALFVFIVMVNSLVGVRWPEGALRPPELLVIFAAGFAATPLTTSDMLDWLFSAIAVPYYEATPENRWPELLLPYIKHWWVVADPTRRLRWAFLGMPEGRSIPWGIWFVPLFWWSSFLAALFVVSASITVFLRRQWVEHERLIFPLVQLPIEMLERPGGRFKLPAMLRSRLFWTGAALPLSIILWNIIGYFVHGFPRIGLLDQRWMTVARSFPPISTKINAYAMGFAYLVDTRILLSVWVFWLIGWIQMGVSTRLGFTLGPAGDLMSGRDAITSWVGMGAMIVLVFGGIWMARHHLLRVWRKIRCSEYALDDSQELLSFRWALIGLLAGLIYMAGWLHAQGMTWGIVALFLFGTLVIDLGLARIVAQTGLIYVRGPLTANLFALYFVGAANLPRETMAALGGAYTITAFNKGMFLPHIFHFGKLAPYISRWGRSVMKLLVISTVIGMIIGVWYTIVESYHIGAVGFGSWPYPKHGLMIYDPMVSHIKDPMGPDLARLACLGIGALIMVGLTVAYYRLPWWQLHPLGFPMFTTWNIEITVLTIFIVWLAKSIILRLGGMQLYEKSKPFFIGIPIGYTIGIVISFVVDLIWFPGVGTAHRLHEW